jgi:phage-related protein
MGWIVCLTEPAQEELAGLLGGIWEFRADTLEGTARALYITRGMNVFVLVVFAKKAKKTPSAMIELAERRSKEV